ncbi:MAG: hypothetical protein IJ618_05480 [Prevotella sp.]|nr:hypothetical protein [Prevotella sp.]
MNNNAAALSQTSKSSDILLSPHFKLNEFLNVNKSLSTMEYFSIRHHIRSPI